jgi:hypothetical protein
MGNPNPFAARFWDASALHASMHARSRAGIVLEAAPVDWSTIGFSLRSTMSMLKDGDADTRRPQPKVMRLETPKHLRLKFQEPL